MPRVTFFGVELNPGPFTVKEHVIVTIMAGVGAQSAYAVCRRFQIIIVVIIHLLPPVLILTRYPWKK